MTKFIISARCKHIQSSKDRLFIMTQTHSLLRFFFESRFKTLAVILVWDFALLFFFLHNILDKGSEKRESGQGRRTIISTLTKQRTISFTPSLYTVQQKTNLAVKVEEPTKDTSYSKPWCGGRCPWCRCPWCRCPGYFSLETPKGSLSCTHHKYRFFSFIATLVSSSDEP